MVRRVHWAFRAFELTLTSAPNKITFVYTLCTNTHTHLHIHIYTLNIIIHGRTSINDEVDKNQMYSRLNDSSKGLKVVHGCIGLLVEWTSWSQSHSSSRSFTSGVQHPFSLGTSVVPINIDSFFTLHTAQFVPLKFVRAA